MSSGATGSGEARPRGSSSGTRLPLGSGGENVVADRRAKEAWALLAQVPDPEIPVISVVDLGIVRSVDVSDDGNRVTVAITPTYSGCPATLPIREAVRDALGGCFEAVEVRTVLAPAWTTDWLSDEGRRRLREYGIAPPERPTGRSELPMLGSGRPSTCPHCGDAELAQISEFGSTPCKALWRCLSCREPFDYFKCL